MLDAFKVLDAETAEDRSGICDEGMAVVTFELVDPSESSRVEIDWEASVESSVFTEPETFDVHVEG